MILSIQNEPKIRHALIMFSALVLLTVFYSVAEVFDSIIIGKLKDDSHALHLTLGWRMRCCKLELSLQQSAAPIHSSNAVCVNEPQGYEL